MKDKISKEQKEFYIRNKQELIDKYFANFSNQVDPDAVRDLFAPIGYDRTNVQKFQGICKVLTRTFLMKFSSEIRGWPKK